MKERRYLAFLCLVMVAAVLAVGEWVCSAGGERCAICGMDTSKYPHTRYVVRTTDGRRFTTCGVQCGLTLHVKLKDKWNSASATDLLSNRAFDATKGYYVYKSSAITDMAPGFVAFKLITHAEKFAKGFGGEVVSYDQALSLWKKQME
jgi:hypothetical protein